MLILLSGFHASTVEEYAKGFEKALSLSSEDALAMRLRAQQSARRFSEAVFEAKWLEQTAKLLDLYSLPA